MWFHFWFLTFCVKFNLFKNLKDLRNQVTDVIVPLPPLQSKEKFLKNKIYVRHNFKNIIEMETSMNLIWIQYPLCKLRLRYLFLKISNLAKYHFEFLPQLLSKPSEVGLIDIFHPRHHFRQGLLQILRTKVHITSSLVKLCLWGIYGLRREHKRAFKAATLAAGSQLDVTVDSLAHEETAFTASSSFIRFSTSRSKWIGEPV